MSSMPASRDPMLYVQDAKQFISNIKEYTKGFSEHTLRDSGIHFDATIRNLEILGEAIKNIPNDLKSKEPNIPWSNIAGFRNRLAHAYFGIDDEIIWDIINNHLTPLSYALKRMEKDHSS